MGGITVLIIALLVLFMPIILPVVLMVLALIGMVLLAFFEMILRLFGKSFDDKPNNNPQ